MNTRNLIVLCGLVLLLCSCGERAEQLVDCPPASAEEPAGLLLTWRRDPTTTMVIDWHVEPQDQGSLGLCLKRVGAEGWQRLLEAEKREYPHSERSIHRVELTELEPGTEYRFRVGEFGRNYKFRTMPESIDDEPLVYASGGDTMHARLFFELMNEVVMTYDPAFIVLGGDLAQDDGKPENVALWDEWFGAVRETLVAHDGRVVPILPALGNHDVRRGYIFQHENAEDSDAFRESIAPFFYGFFAFPGHPGHNVLDFGDYLSLIALDTEHSSHIEGKQTEWLSDVLSDRAARGIPHIFPYYHVSAYPSHRPKDGRVNTLVRENFVPLFETHGVKFAFEHHDHTYKRTHPILDGDVDARGVIYLGDGGWGSVPRSVDSERWYIDQHAGGRFHALIVSLHGNERHFRAVDNLGEVFDELIDSR